MNSVKHDWEELKARVSQHYPTIAMRRCKDAYTVFSELCAAGDPSAWYWCGWLYLKGRGVPRDTEEGFAHMLKAACCDLGNNRSLCFLAECYEKGVGVDKNPVEAYIWALMFFANEDREDADAQTAALERELSPAAARKAEKEARRREKLRQEGKLTPEYCLAKAAKYKPGLPPGDRVHIIGRAVIPPDPIPAPEPREIFPDDPHSANILEYKFLSRIRSDKQPFDLGKVRLQIVTDGFQKGQRVDFSELVVSYGDKGQNRKRMSLFHKLKICAQERRLLVKLAILAADRDSRERKLKSFIQSADPKQLSHLNAMFRALFGEYAEPASSLLNRKDGTLKVNLGVDRLTLRQARDYQEFDL